MRCYNKKAAREVRVAEHTELHPKLSEDLEKPRKRWRSPPLHRSPRATLCEEVKILLIEKTSSGEEVMPMYVTLEELLAVLTLIAFVVSIVLDANNNKKN